MTTTAPLTKAQTQALEALLSYAEVYRSRTGNSVIDAPYAEASDLGASPAALRALVKRRYVRTSSSIARMHGWAPSAYALTAMGRHIARSNRRTPSPTTQA